MFTVLIGALLFGYFLTITQTPQKVIDAMTHYLVHHNANHGGLFATSVESDAMLDAAHQAAADLVGTDDPATVYFGQNMTSLTFALSRSVARRWRSGDSMPRPGHCRA